MSFTTGDVNSDKLGRPSGIPPYQTRARKSWVMNLDEKVADKLRQIDREDRFAIYKEIDNETLAEFVKLLRDGTEGDEAMILAGELVARNIKM